MKDASAKAGHTIDQNVVISVRVPMARQHTKQSVSMRCLRQHDNVRWK